MIVRPRPQPRWGALSAFSAPAAAKTAVVAAVAVVAYFLWRSLEWRLIHDAALMHYIAWLIQHGAVPYRDTFDMNLPGAYLIHLALITVAGAGEAAWFVFERAWLAATVIAMYVYGRPLGNRWSAALGGLLFAIYHLGGGASLAGQRDFLLCLLLVSGAYLVACWWESGGRRAPLAWAGLVLGFAVMVKPLAIGFFAACAGATFLAARRARWPWLGAAGALLGAGLVAPVALLGWLAVVGGLGEFFRIGVAWTLPFYSQVGSARSPLRILVSLNWALLAAAALLATGRSVPRPYGLRRGLAVAGVVYGFLNFVLQAKGYDYHLYPLAMSLCLLAGAAMAPYRRDAREADVRPWTHAVAIALVAAAIMVMAGRGVERLNQPWEAQRVERVDAVVGDLRRQLARGDTVQVLGPPGGHVLLRLGLGQPTRFFTDFQFYVRTDDPRIHALRSEFMAGLEADPPTAIVAFPGRNFSAPYERLAEFPELHRLLERDYAVAIEGNGYRIYRRRAGAPA